MKQVYRLRCYDPAHMAPNTAPGRLVLVQDFVNTEDFEEGTDALGDPGSLAAWLREHGLLDGPPKAGARDVTKAREVRDALRALTVANNGEPLDGALGVLLAVVQSAQADGTWSRLKACSQDDCRWVFYDRSRNRSSRWCEMAVCGNRNKAREFRRRRAS